MKKITKIVIGSLIALGIAVPAYAAVFIVPQGGTGQSTFSSSQLLYGVGANAIRTVATTSVICSGTVTCSPFVVIGGTPITLVGSASGGSSGTWSTTTSNVLNQLINFSNNNTDIVSVGSNSTTTAFAFLDPNIKLFRVNGSVGTTSLPVNYMNTNFLTVNSTSNLGTVASGLWNGTAVTVPFGGTGQTSFTSGNLLYGAGTGAVQNVATGTVSSSGGITVTAGQSIIGSGLTVGCTASSASLPGCLSAADWSRFDNKVSSTSLSGASVISYTGSSGVITTTGGTFGAGNYVFPSQLTVSASTTLQNFTGINATTTSATSTNLATTNFCLSLDCRSAWPAAGSTYPFNVTTPGTGNATSSLVQFNGGLTAYASSTIGAGGQGTGLTISGGATTTGNANVVGSETASFYTSNSVSRINTFTTSVLVNDYVPATTTTIRLSMASSTAQTIRLGISATTVTLADIAVGSVLRAEVCNPGASAGAITWVATSPYWIRWTGGTTPTQTTTANACDLWTFSVSSGTTTTGFIHAAQIPW